jgi:hypothetical protein
MTEWNDGSLDQKFLQIDQRFDQVEKKMDEGFARVDKGFARVDRRFEQLDSRFEALHRMLFQAAWALVVGLLTLVGVLIGLVVT